MAWIGKSQGVFKLRDSDNFCGSFLSVADAAEILAVSESAVTGYAQEDDDGNKLVSELDLHKRWAAGDIVSPHPVKVGSAKRSFDEIILKKLIEVTMPEVSVEIQVPFGRKHVDLVVNASGQRKAIEFLGPSHFIQQYQKELVSPFERKQEMENILNCECVLWPYWIQRCSQNIRAIFDGHIEGKASVWSTNAHFGDFQLHDAARIIVQITERFHALRQDGIGYMYLNNHTKKPIHPIIEQIRIGNISKNKLIPRENHLAESFWLPPLDEKTALISG
jgi:hypothetical protein